MQVYLGDLEVAASSHITQCIFFLILSKERKKTEPLAVIDFNHEEDSALPDRIKFVAIVPLLIFCFNRGAVFPL